MQELFVRTLSQGLQAFMPVALFLSYARSLGRVDLIRAARLAIAAALVITFPAGYLFQRATHQAGIEALLAASTVAFTIWFARSVRSGDLRAPLLAVVAAQTLILVRQTMEIEVVLWAAFVELRSLDATVAVCGAVLVSALAALAWTLIARRLSVDAVREAGMAFAAVFLVQGIVYALHESAEARWLPWSEPIHAASEPYGPEGQYGQKVSFLLFAIPLLSIAVIPLRDRAARLWRARPRRLIAASMLGAVCLVAIGASGRAARSFFETPPVAPAADAIAAITSAPHVVYRHTGVDASYNVTKVATLAKPEAALPVGLPCERVSFSVGRGICLQADRGMFTTYKAQFFDRAFKPTGSMKLGGSPSRTRISRDGRVGAFTVFLTGHAYAATGFSTQTVLLDMASGDVLGELEQFATWRNGARFKAEDFNFWGVTFTRDSNIFYASLGTGGKSYMVKGDLGLRKLTVVADNVECPSISPDDRLIAFKRRVATAADAWRLHVMDVATMTARQLASETRFVDDQVEWLDNGHLLYAIQRPSSAISDVWVASADGSAPARMFLSEAASPIIVR
jgi:hypothetical protein